MLTTSQTSEVVKVSKFGAIGVINTLIDVALLNFFHFQLGIPKLQANFFSTGIAMTFSFFANKQLVFGSRQGNLWLQAIKFFTVTAFGLWVLQAGVIKLLTEVWLGPGELATDIVELIGLSKLLSPDFIALNSAKAVAILVSMIWNYVMYKKVVFIK